MQKRCVEWFRWYYPQFIIAAVPNGANRQYYAQTQTLKDEGMLPGFPDLIVPHAAGQYHGLYIEMKTLKGSAQDNQLAIHAVLRAAGNEVLIPRTFEEFVAQVKEYFLN